MKKLLLLASIAFLIIPFFSLAQNDRYCPGYSGGMMGGGWWGMPMGFGILGGIFSFLIWILIIWGIIYLVRGATKEGWSGYGRKGKSRALDLLEERYAKGEISKEEFVERRNELMNKITDSR